MGVVIIESTSERTISTVSALARFRAVARAFRRGLLPGYWIVPGVGIGPAAHVEEEVALLVLLPLLPDLLEGSRDDGVKLDGLRLAVLGASEVDGLAVQVDVRPGQLQGLLGAAALEAAHPGDRSDRR